MKDKKLQVFVSSTFTDLREERQAAVEAILSSGNIPAGMELFSAGDESQMTVIKRWIDESDVYLLILGGRYGSVEPTSGKSYTHLEYEYALEQKKPLFAVVITEKALNDKVKGGVDFIERNNSHLLNEFRTEVLSNISKFWDDTKDIKLAIHETLSEFNYRKGLIGWVRGDHAVNGGLLAEEIARLAKENAELREKLMQISNKVILYNNLTYEELKQLLERIHTTTGGIQVNLIQYLMKNVHYVIKNHVVGGNDLVALENLAEYKVVRKERDYGGTGKFVFTDDGHNFYLKHLSYSMNQPLRFD